LVVFSGLLELLGSGVMLNKYWEFWLSSGYKGLRGGWEWRLLNWGLCPQTPGIYRFSARMLGFGVGVQWWHLGGG
jgi:hypothetical protein